MSCAALLKAQYHLTYGLIAAVAALTSDLAHAMLHLFQWWSRTPSASQQASNNSGGDMGKKRVVILGGSFGGLTAARSLCTDPLLDVLVIERKNYFEYTPSVLRVLVEPDHMDAILVPLRQCTTGYAVVQGIADKITNHAVYVGAQRYEYDYLIIATGSNYASFIRPHGAEDDLSSRRGNLAYASQRLATDMNKITIVGGGLVAVELATEIADKFPGKEVHVHTMDDRLLALMPPAASTYARRCFAEMKINLRTGVTFNIRGYEPTDDELFLPCVGLQTNDVPVSRADGSEDAEMKANPANKTNLNRACHVDRRGMVPVLQTLQLDQCPNVFAIGDCMVHSLNQEKMAYSAELNAMHVAKCIKAMAHGANPVLQPYPVSLCGVSTSASVCAVSLGQRDALVLFNNHILLWGRPAAFVKHFIEYTKVDQYRNGFIGTAVWELAEPVNFFLNRVYRSFQEEYAVMSCVVLSTLVSAASFAGFQSLDR